MKVRNRVISFVMLWAILFAMAIPTNAVDSGIMPCYNNTDGTYANFAIDDSGIATSAYSCQGYNNITTTIKVEIQLQKKTWWWYNDVEGAYWKDVVDYYHCSGEHSMQLTQGGTYKSVVTFTVYGCGGVADVITSELEASY